MIISMIGAKKIDANDTNDEISFEPITKQQLRGLSVTIKSLEAFEKIHERVIEIAVDGGTEYKYKLCFKDYNITTMVNEMMHEIFPDSTIETVNISNCTVYKINW